MADVPFNPNDPQQQPKKMKADDIMDFDEVRRSFKQFFGKTYEEAADQYKKNMEEATKKATKFQEEYFKFIHTKERRHFENLKKQYDVIRGKLKAIQKTQETNIAKITSLAKRQNRELTQEEHQRIQRAMKARERAIIRTTNLEKSKQKDLEKARKLALASEGKTPAMSRIGGTIGKAAGGVPFIGPLIKGMNLLGTAVTLVAATITKLFGAAIEKRRSIEKVATSFRGAGLSAADASKKSKELEEKFSEIGSTAAGIGVLGLREMIESLGEFPTVLNAIGKSGENAETELAFAMRSLGVELPDALKSMGEVASEQGLNIEEMTDKLKLARGASLKTAKEMDTLAMGSSQAYNILLNMNKSLRNVTFSADESNRIFSFLFGSLKDMGTALRLGDKEVEAFMTTLIQGTANLKYKDIAGMFAFVHGKLPSGSDLKELADSGGQFALQMKAVNKVMGNELTPTFEELSESGVARLNSAIEQFGVSLPDEKAIIPFVKALNKAKDAMKGTDAGGFVKGTETLADSLKATQEEFEKEAKKGREAQEDVKTPMQKLNATITNLSDKGIPGLTTAINSLIDSFESLTKILGTPGAVKEKFGQAISYGKEHPFQTAMMGSPYGPFMTSYNVAKNLRDKFVGEGRK